MSHTVMLFYTARIHAYTLQVVGANPEGPNVPDEQRIAKLYEPGALPKLQSFKAAIHSDGTKLLIVGGRYGFITVTFMHTHCMPISIYILQYFSSLAVRFLIMNLNYYTCLVFPRFHGPCIFQHTVASNKWWSSSVASYILAAQLA